MDERAMQQKGARCACWCRISRAKMRRVWARHAPAENCERLFAVGLDDHSVRHHDVIVGLRLV